MTVPQVKDRPASALRAMFAGLGSLLSVVDKVRSKPAAEAPADVEASAPQATEPVETTEAAAPETTADPDTAKAETTDKPDVVVVEASTAPAETAAEPEAADALPLANYDELTVASLRARLRNLSNDDLTRLSAYEQAHQNRPEVIKMFNNRLIKMTSGFQKLEA
ncbi:MAG TPA: hypothetical protein VIZ43_16755 [Trebonia sp.]